MILHVTFFKYTPADPSAMFALQPDALQTFLLVENDLRIMYLDTLKSLT